MLQPNDAVSYVSHYISSDTSKVSESRYLWHPPLVVHELVFSSQSDTLGIDIWSCLSTSSQKHILEGLSDYIEGRYDEFETIDDLIEELNAQTHKADT